MGDELILKSEIIRRASEKDPVLAQTPRAKLLPVMNNFGYEPIDPNEKVFLSPVFLVDPMFTNE